MSTEKSAIWFSHVEDRYVADLEVGKKKFYWTGSLQTWDWSNCTVSAVKAASKLRIVIRSEKSIQSEYRKKQVVLRYMLGFDTDYLSIKPPAEEQYREPISNRDQQYGPPKTRWVVHLDSMHDIWQWKDGSDISQSEIYRAYLSLLRIIKEPPANSDKNLFNVYPNDDNEIGRKIVPVVYQPAIDSWKNFLREVHCKVVEHDDKGRPKKIEVSLMFNNEQLRQHAIANRIYEWFRGLFYGRTIDIESFFIQCKDEPELFDFPDIYSGDYGIQSDTIHIPRYGVRIKYYVGNGRHPIIFINTSNHAMAEHDTNHRLWKWEYIAWQQDGPVDFGEESRSEIDNRFRPKLRFW
ncbi:MAG: hypothetical protein DA330_04670 [Nitrososphaera sp.]|nr:hypothetical protein [Nitrososphaera sp.]